MTINDKIKSEREKRGWSLERLAVECEVGYHTVYAWDRGRRGPNAEALNRLARAFGTTMEALLDD